MIGKRDGCMKISSKYSKHAQAKYFLCFYPLDLVVAHVTLTSRGAVVG